jgi:hypothetical protein
MIKEKFSKKPRVRAVGQWYSTWSSPVLLNKNIFHVHSCFHDSLSFWESHYVAQMVLNSWFSCPSLQSAETTGACQPSLCTSVSYLCAWVLACMCVLSLCMGVGLHVCPTFLCMGVGLQSSCSMCMSAQRGQRKCRISWNWSYGGLWTVMWVLRLQPESSRKADSALNSKPSLQP